MWCNFALSPLNFSWICNCPCKFKWGLILYAFGVFFCKDFNSDVLMMFWATHEVKVWSPDPGAFRSFYLQRFQLQCIWKCCSSDLFNLVPCHLLSSSQPQHISICSVAGFQQLLHLPMCQVHRHYSVSGIVVTFTLFKFLQLFCWSCHAIMLLTPKIRLRTKPLQCK